VDDDSTSIGVASSVGDSTPIGLSSCNAYKIDTPLYRGITLSCSGEKCEMMRLEKKEGW